MVQINYTKESGIKQQSGSAGFTIPSDITIGHPFTDSPTGNTVSTLDLTGIKHSDTPAGADEISLDGKYITFRSANGDSFYVWFNPGDDAGSTDPLLSGIAIPVIAAPADLNTDAKIIDQIVLALNASAAFTKEFHLTPSGATLKICAKRMGDSGKIVDISTLEGVTAGDGSTVSASLTTTSGSGSYLISEKGLSHVKSASADAGGGALVVLKNLKQSQSHGAQKIVLSTHPQDATVKNYDEDVDFVTFDAVGDALHLIWNGTAWKSVYSS